MSNFTTQGHTITVSPLPPLPDRDPLTTDQWRTLLAICDSYVAPIQPIDAAKNPKNLEALAIPHEQYSKILSSTKQYARDNGEGTELAGEYLQEAASSYPSFRAVLQRTIASHMSSSKVKELALVLNMLKYVASRPFSRHLPYNDRVSQELYSSFYNIGAVLVHSF
jgi:hypothetical protein